MAVGALVRTCGICGITFTADGFGKGMKKYCGVSCAKTARGRRGAERNREQALKRRNQQRVRRARLVEQGLPYRDPLYQRDYDLRRNYGITLAEYDALAASQGGVCAVCREQCPTGRRLSVDHDHQSGQVRGLLCSRCNQALGLFRDRSDLLLAAIQYIGGGE